MFPTLSTQTDGSQGFPPLPAEPVVPPEVAAPPEKKRGIGGKIGGIFATLMGITHAEEVARKEAAGNYA